MCTTVTDRKCWICVAARPGLLTTPKQCGSDHGQNNTLTHRPLNGGETRLLAAMDAGDHKAVQLSAEVEPFVPEKRALDPSLVAMGLSGEVGGAAPEGPPIPSYLITCYPFVQENQPSRPLPLYGGDSRWLQPSPSHSNPYMAYHLLSSGQPAVPSDCAYYHLVPASCPPLLGFYPSFPSGYGTAPIAARSAVITDCGDLPLALGQAIPAANQRAKAISRATALPKQPMYQPQRGKRAPSRGVVVQKEVPTFSQDGRPRAIMLVDAAQQTDLPRAADGASPSLWKSRARRKRVGHLGFQPSGEQGASEADIDSDSGYCSPKHVQAAAASHGAKMGVEAAVMTGVSWLGVASQRPWGDRNGVCHREGQVPSEQRAYSQQDIQVQQGDRSGSSVAERGSGPQRKLLLGTEPSTEPLYFEDEEEFPGLMSGGGGGGGGGVSPPRGTLEGVPPKLPKGLLDSLPEGSPMSIVKTPIPITTSVPKRAKSQRKKALAAALATAQEYSEISWEQKKLQEALSKAAGKKSKTPVQLDLGDMLAALEKQQQAMKARQLTNTKPLSYTVGTLTALPVKDSGGKLSGASARNQACTPPHNILDSSAPRVKRGKEREIPKAKRPTALKKVILKEREGKKEKPPLDSDVAGAEEEEEEDDASLSFTEDLTQEHLTPDEHSLSVPSEPSLSPASQNSPYSITPVSQGSPASSGVGSPLAASTITKIHSRRFREYCNQVLNKEIDESATLLLQELVRFQERIYQRDPSKAKSKRRLVMGLREVTKHMKLLKIKCVIISPNCEKIQAKGGLDEALYNVIAMAREQEIPFVFALGRKALGRCVNKLVPVSVVGIFNFSGAEELFHKLVSLTEEARQAYRDMVSALEQEQAEEALRSVRKLPHHMGHSRNPSAASAISFCSVISEPISEVNEQEYETNWRNMVELSDVQEPAEGGAEKEPGSRPAQTAAAGQSRNVGLAAEREEGRLDDSLECASQHSQHCTETGSLDGSGRDPHSSSITSTASTLVPGMLEEGEEEEEEEEEEEDYTHRAVSLEVPPLSSRIESWVSETLENLQLQEIQNSSEDEQAVVGEGVPSEEELDAVELSEPMLDYEEQQLDAKGGSL
ncbi:selenocysteine insertion sequence-binding protein 2-like isoform X3 [Brienomyrus brachyistius]|uniref:selenocysteine insertion sequence-binding protein 2-like isoform X3 n=1 Tax=Brienomyrus brachyistius TaxID=42636 RepID=UPI0020B1DF51|nr:selenocysteine insertion sequence-binding protein 2-like isoform X3 [Brienomyrus brachyistius]